MVALLSSKRSSMSPVSTLKKLLKSSPPATTTAPVSPSPATTPRLSAHIIYEIGRRSDVREVLQLSLCSRRLRSLLAPLLYSTVTLSTNRHCKNTLLALSKHPELVYNVRKLVLHVNNIEWTDHGDEIDEDLILSLVSRMASAGFFQGLEAFEWDGLEMPDDEFWLAMQTSCPTLKRISTTVGEDRMSPSSPLWDFNDLRQFSLTVKCQSLQWLAGGLPKPEKLPRKFWAMLLERCPRLESLTLGSPAPSPRLFDIRPVISGRWPRLHSITLGDTALISPDKTIEHDFTRSFMTFFAIHRGLRHIGLEHAGGSAYFPGIFDFPSLGTLNVLPHLTSFSGSLRYLKTIPIHLRQQLRSLRLTCLHHTVTAIGPTIKVLRDLYSLEDLGIWVDLSFGSIGIATNLKSGKTRRASMDGVRHDECGSGDAHIFQALFDACPDTLKHLDIACYTRPGLAIKDFSTCLTHAPPMLQSFHLLKVHKSGDEDLTQCAARIVSDVPNIKNFTLKTTMDSWFSGGGRGGRVRSMGVYEVVGDTADGNSNFLVSEGLQLPVLSETMVLGGAMVASTTSNFVSSPAALTPFVASPMSSSVFSSKHSTHASRTSVTLVGHEWGQKSLTRKEFVKHFTSSLSEKEMESYRSSSVRKKRRSSVLSAFSAPPSASVLVGGNVSRRSSSSSGRASSISGYGSINGHGYASSLGHESLHGHSHSLSVSEHGSICPRQASVTWADRSLVNTGSLDGHAGSYYSATSRSRRSSREMSIVEGYVLI